MKHVLVLAAFAATVTAQAAPTWAQITSFTSPGVAAPARRAGAMAFDGITNKLIAYGGLSVGPTAVLNQTWSYGTIGTGTGWVQLAPTGNPPARWGHRMVRKTQNNRLITFGGRSPTIGSFANDTWEYLGSTTGGSWTQTIAGNPSSTQIPSPRYLYGFAYDEVRQVAILFGGSNAVTTFGDTWEYNGTTWTQRTFPPLSTPTPREDMVLVYDAALNRTVLFGGFDPVTNEPLGDTWLYDGTTWSLQVAPSGTPSPRFATSAIYDSVRKRVVMFGGFDGVAVSSQTFQFAGDSWQLIAGTAPLPPNATEAYAGFDPQRRKFVLQGGFGVGFTGQTWELNVAAGNTGQPGLYGTFAPGCTVLSPAPTIAGTVPTIGQPLTTTIGNLNVNPTVLDVFVVHVIGASNQVSGPLPLPLDLSVLGLTGCSLYVASDFIEAGLAITPQVPPAQPVPLPSVQFSLAIPNNTTLVNRVLYSQAFSLTEIGFASASAPARFVIGTP